tara:strand:- start:1957 stop:2295 length:339 start_codon:yes stop_codon:yes gene_type:complete
MARNAYNFGDVAEFTVWATSHKARLTQENWPLRDVVCLYKKQTGRNIGKGVVDRVFTRLEIPFSIRKKRKNAITVGMLAKEIALINERMKRLTEDLGCSWSDECVSQADLEN